MHSVGAIFIAIGDSRTVQTLASQLTGELQKFRASGDVLDSSGNPDENNSIIVKLPLPTEDDVAVFDETKRWLEHHETVLSSADARKTIEFQTFLDSNTGSRVLTVPNSIVRICAALGLEIANQAFRVLTKTAPLPPSFVAGKETVLPYPVKSSMELENKVVLTTSIVVDIDPDEDGSSDRLEQIAEVFQQAVRAAFSADASVQPTECLAYDWLNFPETNFGRCMNCNVLVTDRNEPGQISGLMAAETVDGKWLCHGCNPTPDGHGFNEAITDKD
jgi:hypothetical protein